MCAEPNGGLCPVCEHLLRISRFACGHGCFKDDRMNKVQLSKCPVLIARLRKRGLSALHVVLSNSEPATITTGYLPKQ